MRFGGGRDGRGQRRRRRAIDRRLRRRGSRVLVGGVRGRSGEARRGTRTHDSGADEADVGRGGGIGGHRDGGARGRADEGGADEGAPGRREGRVGGSSGSLLGPSEVFRARLDDGTRLRAGPARDSGRREAAEDAPLLTRGEAASRGGAGLTASLRGHRGVGAGFRREPRSSISSRDHRDLIRQFSRARRAFHVKYASPGGEEKRAVPPPVVPPLAHARARLRPRWISS